MPLPGSKANTSHDLLDEESTPSRPHHHAPRMSKGCRKAAEQQQRGGQRDSERHCTCCRPKTPPSATLCPNPHSPGNASMEGTTHTAPPLPNPAGFWVFTRERERRWGEGDHDIASKKETSPKADVDAGPNQPARGFPRSRCATPAPNSARSSDQPREDKRRRGGSELGAANLQIWRGRGGLHAVATRRRRPTTPAVEDAGQSPPRAPFRARTTTPCRQGPPPLGSRSSAAGATRALAATVTGGRAGLPGDPLRWRRGGSSILFSVI